MERRRRHGHDRHARVERELPVGDHDLYRADADGSYGIFVSNSARPGAHRALVRGNMADSGYYIGACQRGCNTVLADAHAQYSALGYSGTNSGGQLILKNTEFDHNKTGVQHEQPEQRRRALASGRRVPDGGTARPDPIVLGLRAQLRPRQQQPERPAAGALGPPGTRHRDLRRSQRHVVDNRFENNGAGPCSS